MSDDSSASDTSSVHPPSPRSRKLEDAAEHDTDSGVSSASDDDDDDAVSNADESSDTPVLSHAAQRKQKRKEQREATKSTASSARPNKKQKVTNAAELPPSKLPPRQNSVWVGNLSFKTTPQALRQFFDGVGEITRLHMPMKLASAGPDGTGTRKENRGFAYVDFASADAKTVAITLSENPLDGRRLLIKDGHFEGRPAPPNGGSADPSAKPAGLSKRAQQILAAQKQPPGQTLFMGNLAFSTTQDSIRTMLESHRPKRRNAPAADPWIRQVRLGTFEDSGKCKGWAFVDFVSTEHATAALTNVRNHQLDGRALVVEYASPDAVRRGGGPRNNGTRSAPPREGARSPKRKARAEEDEADEGGDGIGVEPIEETPLKRRRVDSTSRTPARDSRGGKPPRTRTKPGAALAQAKRETVAIVPSQGRKIVFD
ncbi:hypothetical protein B0H21DRAFT_801113 [Amylocystis lapponica]|nr:hypothetical protein B0H21DRAFT_801113 [Amylocystis lapponica]